MDAYRLVGVVSLATVVAFAATPAAEASYRPQLRVTTGAVGFGVPPQDDGTARVEITSPVWGPIADVPGTAVGDGAFASAQVATPLSSPTSMSGPIVVAMPQDFLDAAARCRAPAPNAVWLLELTARAGPIRRLVVPVFFSQDQGLTQLSICFDSPPTTSTLPRILSLLINTNEFPAPVQPGRYVWHGLFTAFAVSGSALGAKVEARSIQPLPTRITLAATFTRREWRVGALLHGRLVEAGQPAAGARIRLEARRPAGLAIDVWTGFRTTRRDGTFSFRRPVRRTLGYIASVVQRDVTSTECGGSTAPEGCVSALIAPPNPAAVLVRAH